MGCIAAAASDGVHAGAGAGNLSSPAAGADTRLSPLPQNSSGEYTLTNPTLALTLPNPMKNPMQRNPGVWPRRCVCARPHGCLRGLARTPALHTGGGAERRRRRRARHVTQVHISGLGEHADETSLVATMEACGLSEECGWVTTQLVRDRDTDQCRCAPPNPRHLQTSPTRPGRWDTPAGLPRGVRLGAVAPMTSYTHTSPRTPYSAAVILPESVRRRRHSTQRQRQRALLRERVWGLSGCS